MNSTDHVPAVHWEIYGSVGGGEVMKGCGRTVRMKLVEEMGSLAINLKGVKRGVAKIVGLLEGVIV